MALATDSYADLGGELRRFALPLGQLEELDEKTGTGPLAALTRLLDGSWRLPDVRDTIRLGLIGGGLPPVDAAKLVRRHVDGRPLEEAVPIAATVLLAALRGRKVRADEGNAETARSASDPTGSTSPSFDATPSSSD